MKKTRFTAATLALLVLVLSAFVSGDTPEKNSLGRFHAVKGMTIFYMAEPIHEYEVLETIHLKKASSFSPQRTINYLMDDIQKKGIKADAAIAQTEDMHIFKLIKFSDPELSDDARSMGKAPLVNNTYLFFRSLPIQDYEVLCEVIIRIPGDIGPGGMTNELWMRMNKKCPEAEAMILSTNMTSALAVKFKE